MATHQPFGSRFGTVGVASCLFALILAACGSGDATDPGFDGLPSVPLSPELRGAVDAALRSLETPDRGDPQVRLDLDRYWGLQEMFFRPELRDVAEDSLLSLWRRDLSSVLWVDLAALNWNYFRDPAAFDAMFERPAFPDSASALGRFVFEWKSYRTSPDTEDFGPAWDARDELSPFERAWLTLRLSRQRRFQGRADEAAELVLELLPSAGEVGGRRLELEAWIAMTRALREGDHLDDALHAATIAGRLASAVTAESGNRYLLLQVDLDRAEVLGARREIEPALALYRSCVDSALDRGLSAFAERSLNYAGIFTGGCGLLEEGLVFYRRSLALSLADRDSLSTPQHLANLGRRHLLLGDLDSCLVYFREADRWIDAYPDPTNRAFFGLMEAEYYAQVGDYPKVDSLLAAAASLIPSAASVEKLAELHLQVIQLGTERGRPEQSFRSIAFLESLRDRLQTASADRNELFDLDLASAEFFGRQGLYARAADALIRADGALAQRPDPTRARKLLRAHGDLARRRGDSRSAEIAYRDFENASLEQNDVGGLLESRFLLASTFLDDGRLEEAKEVAGQLRTAQERGPFGGRFRTKLSASILDAAIDAQTGQYDAALATLGEAREACTPGAPPDLLTRIALETGRAAAGKGRMDLARLEFEQASRQLKSARASLPEEAPLYLDRDLRRETLEARLVLELPDSESRVAGRLAEELLRYACDLLPEWPDHPTEAPRRFPQLVYFVGRDATFRWTIGAGGASLGRLPGEVSLLDGLAPVLADLEQPHRPLVRAEWTHLATMLGDAPEEWPTDEVLTVVPDGALFSVPWAALPLPMESAGLWIDRGPILLMDAPASQAEGTGIIDERMTSPSAPEPPLLLALGFDGTGSANVASLRSLHHAEDEARELASLWPAGRVSLRVGADADLRAIGAAELSRFGAIHVASHALVYRGFADRTTLLLVGCEGPPLTSSEIRGLDLDARLVFLSCCEAAEGVRRGSSPAHAGLARSFLAAGAGTVIAPSQRIDDGAARWFASRFYRHWLGGGGGIPGALRNAQRDLRDGDPRWAHPGYWATYQVIAGTSSASPW